MKFKSKFAFVELIRLSQNIGIAGAKNICIRYAMEKDADIGILADDDVYYRCEQNKSIIDVMVECIVITKIDHICCTDTTFQPIAHAKKKNITVQNYNLTISEEYSGVFFTFTKNLIHHIGYLQILPYKWGYEHIYFSKRAIEFLSTHFTSLISDIGITVDIPNC